LKIVPPDFCRRLAQGLTVLCIAATALTARAAELAFRTDGGDEKLPWFALKPGEFPPAGSAHSIEGELIALDHLQRYGVLRPDRTDAQRRGDWDLPLPFILLPYGSITYHGAPADLRHIPIGTHLHGQFYTDQALAKDLKAKLTTEEKRACGEAKFCRVFRLEDDFSYSTRQQRTWRLDAIDWEKMTITVTGMGSGKDQADAKPTIFQIASSTRIRKGRGFGDFSDLAEGQSLIINLTVATLKGPGRCVDIWLDPESRNVATAQQMEVHRQFIREHGLPAIIDSVDNAAGTVTVTLFDGFDTKLVEDFPTNAALAAAAKGPPFVPGPGLVDPIGVTAAVAEDNLRTWDQINDRKVGPLLETIKGEPSPGKSGIRLRFKPVLLLEGFRPQRIIRIWCSKWKVDDLPREEKMYY
jgi:hypothetical protein